MGETSAGRTGRHPRPAWRVRNAAQRPEVLTWGLPYELVAVGIYGDVTEGC